MNPGGPCWSSLIEMFIGLGPYKFDIPLLASKSKLKMTNNKYSSQSLGDTLYIDLPLGAGFSKTKPYPTDYDRNSEDWIVS